MDTRHFNQKMTGELVAIHLPGFRDKETAFIPQPLDPNWEFPNSLWPLLVEAKQILGTLDGIGRTLPNPDLLLQPLQQREALRSSSLEGTFATPEELLLFQLEQRDSVSKSEQSSTWLEVANYRNALLAGFNYLNEYPISISLIRLLHNHLMEGVRGSNKNPGQFREGQVYIGVDKRFIPAPPMHLSSLLGELEKTLISPLPNVDPLIMSYLVHYQFEAIHPFTDGNGRVGRLLLALTTWKWNNLSMPWLYMSAFFEQHKSEYIDKMFNVSAKGDWESWLEFCLKGTIEQSNDSIRRCDELGRLRENMHARIKGISPRTHALIEGLFVQPVLTVPLVRDRFDITYPTAKSDINKLIKAGILKKTPQSSYPAVFIVPEIFTIAYD